MSQLSPSSRITYTKIQNDLSPKKEQWALINEQKAIQYEKLKQSQRIRARQKQQNFKKQLDNQINGKNNVNKIEKQEDRRYYEFITKKALQMKQKQERQKLQKMNLRKNVEEENKFRINNIQRSRSSDIEKNNSSMDIGLASAIQRKRMEENGKKTLVDALNQQLTLKAQMTNEQRLKNLQIQEQNLKYQEEIFEHRNKGGKVYGQNPNIYQQYQELKMDKIKKQRQLERKITQQAALRRLEEQMKKNREKQQKRQFLSHQMKDTLQKQIQLHNHKKQQEARMNPQQHSYSVIGTMFRDKISPYDKKQYSEYLRRQAEQQSYRKKMKNFMSEEQYKLNLNQLNKAVTGSYIYDTYHDRSLIAIGEKDNKLNMSLIDTKNPKITQDAEIVMQRVEKIRNQKGRQASEDYINYNF